MAKAKYTVTCHYPKRTKEEEERREQEIAELLLEAKLSLMARTKSS